MSELVDLIDRQVHKALRRLTTMAEYVDDVRVGLKFAAQIGAAGRSWDADLAGHYGFYSRPPAGADGIVLKVGGKANSTVLIGFRHRPSEPELAADGELGMVDNQGQRVVLLRDGIYIDGAAKVVFAGGVNGAVRVGDGVDGTVGFLSHVEALRVALNALGAAIPPLGTTRIGSAAEGSPKVRIG